MDICEACEQAPDFPEGSLYEALFGLHRALHALIAAFGLSFLPPARWVIDRIAWLQVDEERVAKWHRLTEEHAP